MDSGLYDGQTGPSAKSYVAYREVIQVSGTPWLRLHFSQAYLGSARR
ncbi:MAG: hypothetical protein IID13_08810 [Candidatus Marinimicrobia bacterium]|nr:hypothetical protein [Candidatus Neomarinimicrobiota bacterium]